MAALRTLALLMAISISVASAIMKSGAALAAEEPLIVDRSADKETPSKVLAKKNEEDKGKPSSATKKHEKDGKKPWDEWCQGKEDAHVHPTCHPVEALPYVKTLKEDVQDCMINCDATPTCRSFQVRNGSCQYCATSGVRIRREAGVTVYTKLCSEALTNATVNNSEPWPYDDKKKTVMKRGGWCPPQENTNVNGLCQSPVELPPQNVSDIETCKADCEAQPACQSIHMRGDTCHFCFNNGSVTRADPSVTLYTRLCTDTTTTPARSVEDGEKERNQKQEQEKQKNGNGRFLMIVSPLLLVSFGAPFAYASYMAQAAQ